MVHGLGSFEQICHKWANYDWSKNEQIMIGQIFLNLWSLKLINMFIKLSWVSIDKCLSVNFWENLVFHNQSSCCFWVQYKHDRVYKLLYYSVNKHNQQ